jgi:DNA-binding MarR family transcriptional regulator
MMAVAKPVTTSERAAWRALMGMAFQLAGELGRTLGEVAAISYQDYLVLAVLKEQGGRARPVHLGRELGWEKSRLSHHVSRMIDRGLVKRDSVTSDKRGALIIATPKGLRAADAARTYHDRVVREHFLDLVSDKELATIRRVAERVLASLGSTPS